MTTNYLFLLTALLGLQVSLAGAGKQNQPVYVRFNQAGYLPDDQKELILFSNQPITATFELVNTET
ncbi:MAG: hypothetical protein OEY56_10805, partial [Cyclobacteriaceae bacterium]|nr:hypothetical protein [Cyclobacteriaceae bacterium]